MMAWGSCSKALLVARQTELLCVVLDTSLIGVQIFYRLFLVEGDGRCYCHRSGRLVHRIHTYRSCSHPGPKNCHLGTCRIPKRHKLHRRHFSSLIYDLVCPILYSDEAVLVLKVPFAIITSSGVSFWVRYAADLPFSSHAS